VKRAWLSVWIAVWLTGCVPTGQLSTSPLDEWVFSTDDFIIFTFGCEVGPDSEERANASFALMEEYETLRIAEVDERRLTAASNGEEFLDSVSYEISQRYIERIDREIERRFECQILSVDDASVRSLTYQT
jgi:hypothetical protein